MVTHDYDGHAVTRNAVVDDGDESFTHENPFPTEPDKSSLIDAHCDTCQEETTTIYTIYDADQPVTFLIHQTAPYHHIEVSGRHTRWDRVSTAPPSSTLPPSRADVTSSSNRCSRTRRTYRNQRALKPAHFFPSRDNRFMRTISPKRQ